MSEFEKRKENLIRSLFHDSPDLSTIQEEYSESSTAASPPLSIESHRSYSPAPPPAHSKGLWSPLPPLTIESVKAPNKHDEPEDFYKRLHKKILKIYRRIFFEDRSDISDIITSDDDDEQTELIDYSTNSVELVEMTHRSVNDTNTSNNNEPIDCSTSRIELVKSPSQSVNNITANQENHEDVTTAGTENQGSNEEELLQVNETMDDENESHDNNDVDKYLPNLETIFECDERDLSYSEADEDISLSLEANAESDESELPNIEPEEKIFECDERDILSNSEADEDTSPDLKANVEIDEGDLPNIENDDSDIPNLEANIESDDGRISSFTDVIPNSTQSEESRNSATPLSSTVILSRGTSDEKLCLERNEVSANTHHFLPKSEEIEGGRTSPRASTVSIPRAEANPYEDVNMDIAMETTVSADAPQHSEVDKMEARIRPSTGSIPRAKADPHEENENMEAENKQTEETETPRSHEKTPEPHEETPETNEGTPEPHEGTPEPHEGTPNKDIGDNVAMDIDPDNSIQSEVEEMRTPRPHRTYSPTFQPRNKKHPIEPKIVIVKHHVSMESDKSQNVEETLKRPSTIENPDNLDLFDLIRISSPKEITEGNTSIINPAEYTVNMSSEDDSGDIPLEDNAGDIPPEDNSGDIPFEDNAGNIPPEDNSGYMPPKDNSGRNSPGGNNRKRKSVSPFHSRGKKIKFADKSIQTDDFIISKTVQNIEININLRDKY